MADEPNFGSGLTGGMPPMGGGRSVLGGLFGGRKKSMGDVRAQFKVDATGVNNLASAFKTLKRDVDQFTTATDKATRSLKRFNDEQKKTNRRGPQAPSGPGAPAANTASDSYSNGTNSSIPMPTGAAMGGRAAAGGMGGLAGGGGGTAGGAAGGGMAAGAAGGAIGMAVMAVVQQIGSYVEAIVARVERNMDYALSANQRSVQLQVAGFGGNAQRDRSTSYTPLGGWTSSFNGNYDSSNQRGRINSIRDDLRPFLLGGVDDQGINTALQLARQGGAYNNRTLRESALSAASGMQTVNALSGFSMSTQDQASAVQSAQNPQNVNRLQAFYGINIYGSNGTMDGDPVKKIAQAVMKKFPNFDRKAWSRGMVPGSGVRQALINTGVPEDLIESVIQYVLSQMQYEKMGGNGWVDLGNEKHRDMLGIEDEQATANAQKQNAEATREENMYQRQTDNYARLTRQTERLTEAFGKLEDKLSGVIGGGVSQGGYLAIGKQFLGRVAPILGQVLGDPTGEVNNGLSVPTGYENKRTSIGELEGNQSFAKLDTRMKSRLRQMFTAAGGKLGLGGGWRSEDAQRTMFLDRYRKDPNGDIEWNGSRWKRVKDAPAAPPGRSMHEIGLAADLVGDMGWLQQNAGRFGLKTFADVNNEPWHVQLSELPNSRRKYEEGGGATTDPSSDGTYMPIDGEQTSEHGGDSGMAFFARMLGLNPSMSELIAGGTSTGPMSFGSLGGTSDSEAAAAGVAAAGGGSSFTYSGSGVMRGEDVARVAHAAGFTGETLVKMVAIAQRESSFDPGAHNPKPPDNSFGLWQINMLGNMGKDRLKQFGISKYEDLYDPSTNARAAWILSGGGSNLMPWKIGGNPLAKTDTASAKAYVTAAGLGDPTGEGMVSSGGGGGGTMTVHGGSAFSYNPTYNITLSGSGSAEQDGRRIGEVAFRYSKDKIEEMLLRAS